LAGNTGVGWQQGGIRRRSSSINFFMVHVLSVLAKTFGDLSYGKLLTVK
jgi:hypothetical protein